MIKQDLDRQHKNLANLQPQLFASGKYELLSEINCGSFGRVYLAKCCQSQRQVAVKVEIQKPVAANSIAIEG